MNSSYEAPLPARIDCGGHVEATGFLGLGEGIQHVNATVYNDGDQGGNFQISARAGLAGQSTDAAVVLDQASAYVAAHSQATHTFQFRPSAVQNMEIFCHVTSPMVVQQSTDICPVCSGSGQVMN